jgi:glutamate--cysteine ligase
VNAVASARFAALRDAIHARDFAPDMRNPTSVGAEVEFLAHDVATDRPLPLVGGARSVVALLRHHGQRSGWREESWYGAIPRFDIPGVASVTFEPGGQIEISTVACNTASSLIGVLRAVITPLTAFLSDEGIRLVSVGIDPHNDAPEIPLQLPVERYQRMTEYFDSIGPFGARMMRQTAAVQISLDRGARPAERWRLLNDLAPYVTAIFANSPRHAGRETGHRSYRAHCWRMLDVTRTGVSAVTDDPAAAYTRFALDARDMMRQTASGDYAPFGSWPVGDDADERWRTHLTTLFPEVRPRGHYEVRSCDAIDPAWHVAPIVFLCGIAYDERAARDASLLAADSRALLRRAGEQGLRDSAIARTARDLFQLALAGARRLGTPYLSAEDIDLAEQFARQYTARDRSPADDQPIPTSAADIVNVGAQSR